MLFLSRSLVTSAVMANPASGAPPVCAAAVAGVSDETAGAGAAPSAAEPAFGVGSATVRMLGVESAPLRSFDWKAAACFATGGPGSGAKLSSPIRDLGVGITVGASVGAEDVNGVKLKVGLAGETGLESLTNESAGWSEE